MIIEAGIRNYQKPPSKRKDSIQGKLDLRRVRRLKDHGDLPRGFRKKTTGIKIQAKQRGITRDREER